MKRGTSLAQTLLSVVVMSSAVPPTFAEQTPDADIVGSAAEGSALAPAVVADRETTLAAIQLFNDSVTVQADGKHNRLLRALRHLEDPALGPLFIGLSRASHPSLRVHGLLGVAELSQPRGLSTADIAAVDRPDVQAELISAALDGGLIDDATCSTLLGWQGLDPGVKLLLATPRVAAGEFDKNSPGYADLIEALDDESRGRRGLAALLLTQLGDPRGQLSLEVLLHDTHPSAHAVRATLLETAWTHGLGGVAPWAYEVATTPDTPPRLEMLGLKVAIRFGEPRADTRWAARFIESDDASLQTRLAWVGLEIAPWLSPDRFDSLIASDDPLIQQLGRTGRIVAQSRLGTVEHPAVNLHVAKLIETNHPQACQWAAKYAQDVGSAAIAASVVMKTEPGEPRGRARRLDAVVRSTQTLIDLDPDAAERLLIAALKAQQAEPAWQRGVLLGLIRSRSDTARGIAHQLPDLADRNTEALALVLRLQRPDPLTEAQDKALSLVIRGGAELDDSLRVQGAWAYLLRTGQGDEAIAAVLAEP